MWSLLGQAKSDNIYQIRSIRLEFEGECKDISKYFKLMENKKDNKIQGHT